MGFLSVVVTRGIVKKFPIYSILLFDYNVLYCFVFDIKSFNLQLCVELYDHMKEPIKSSELCYIIPHHDLSFCLLFTNEDDAFIFNTGVIHDIYWFIIDARRMPKFATRFTTCHCAFTIHTKETKELVFIFESIIF